MPGSIHDYEVLGDIGSGTYSRCQRVRRKRDGKVLVWKRVDYGHMTEAEKQMLVSEVNVLRELRHPNIVRYFERVIDKPSSTLYIVMECCEGGDLASFVKTAKKEGRYIDEAFIWRVAYQVTQALHVCHGRARNEKSILHRDIKPANIFLDADRNVKLGDFGLARVLNSDASFAQTFLGTPYYMSPEQMAHDQYSESCDIWSFGCVLYELASLHPPFNGSTQRELTAAIRSGRTPRVPQRYSKNLHELVSSMLALNSERRPTATEILANPRMSKVTPGGRTSPAGPDVDTMRESLLEQSLRLNQREEAIKAKEHALDHREKCLKAREQTLRQKESLFMGKTSSSSSSSRKVQEKENHVSTTSSGCSSKEANDMNNQLVSALKHATRATVTKTPRRDMMLDQIRHLVSSECQDWTKLDLIKQVCRHLESESGVNNKAGKRLAKIKARSTELQREYLELHVHNKRLLGI